MSIKTINLKLTKTSLFSQKSLDKISVPIEWCNIFAQQISTVTFSNHLLIVWTIFTQPICKCNVYVYRQHVNTNCVKFCFTIDLIHLGSTYFNEMIYDVWEAAYHQGGGGDVDNRKCSNISHYCFFPKFRILKWIINRTIDVSRDINTDW